MQKLSNHLLDLHLLCPHPSKIKRKRNVYKRSTSASNSSTSTWRQNNSTEIHYKLSSFNFRMTSHYCATYFSPRLEQFPSVTLPLKPPLPVLQLPLTLTLILTLLQLLCYFTVLMNRNFIVVFSSGRCGTTRSRNKQLCKRWPSVFNHHTGSSSNYGAELHNKNFQNREIICRWNSNLYIYHGGDSLSVLILIW